MWIAEQWRDYEPLDCGGERSWSAGESSTWCGRTPGHLGQPPEEPRLEAGQRPVSPKPVRRRPLGEEDPAGELEDPLPGPDLPGEAHELQAHGPVSGTGGELGFRHGEDPERRAAHPGAEPVRLHRRGYGGLRQGGGQRLPRGRGQGHGGLGQGKRQTLRLGEAPIRWIVDDCGKFVEREIRRGKTYDAIIMDPPSYGRGPGGEVWKLEDNLYDFVKLCAGVLSERPLFVLINSYTTGLAPSVLGYLLHLLVGGQIRRQVHLGRAGPAGDGDGPGSALRCHRPLVRLSEAVGRTAAYLLTLARGRCLPWRSLGALSPPAPAAPRRRGPCQSGGPGGGGWPSSGCSAAAWPW